MLLLFPKNFVFYQALFYVKRGLVSEETVVLRRWGIETRKFGLSTELIM